ncbi:MAG: hypothetical protein JKX92_06250 [Porticoccaceae bacterium]|nr:hypothetical protein [Porticoccaceae bacterium]
MLLLVGLTVLALCIESSPLVHGPVKLSPDNIARAKILYSQHQAGLSRSGESGEILLGESELNLLASYLAGYFAARGAAVELEHGVLVLNVSWDLAALLPHKKGPTGYINLRVVLASTALDDGSGPVRIQSLGIGRVFFPAHLSAALLQAVLEHFSVSRQLVVAANVIQAIDFRSQSMAITYQRPRVLLKAWRGQLISVEQRQILALYQQFLVAEVERQGGGLSFTRLLEAVFGYGLSRSQNSDPVLENRAAIIVLAAYANGGGLSSLVPGAGNWPQPRRASLTLHGRNDLVRHFITSAALTVAGGRSIANRLGLYKEIEDARGGSGFSFKDLAADMAGTQFAELALASRRSARELQQSLSTGQGQTQLLPSLAGLPENLNEVHFRRDYGAVADLRYRRMVLDIEGRIKALALYP